jgi:hypothetical protein
MEAGSREKELFLFPVLLKPVLTYGRGKTWAVLDNQ